MNDLSLTGNKKITQIEVKKGTMSRLSTSIVVNGRMYRAICWVSGKSSESVTAKQLRSFSSCWNVFMLSSFLPHYSCHLILIRLFPIGPI